MRILIIGAGGVGGYLAGNFAKNGIDVTLFATPKTNKFIAKNGLQIKDVKEEYSVCVKTKLSGVYDVIILAVKAYNLDDVLEIIKTHSDENTIVLPLLNEDNINEVLKEIRLVLLEADVNYKVAKTFIGYVKERALGQEVLKSLTPSQQLIKIVKEEMEKIIGAGEDNSLRLKTKPPVVFMLVGLQGSGKTTTAGKIANFLRSKFKKNPLLVPADVYRPAAIDQLIKISKELNLMYYPSTTKDNPVKIAKESLNYAIDHGADVVLIDTAGRLHIDKKLMNELVKIKKAVNPTEILFVADSMTGQEAVNIAKEFDNQLDITGIILTKLDGDARGGAALSIRAITGKPIKLIGKGEKLNDIEIFHPERMVSRILGMGDVLTLIEKASESIKEDELVDLEQRIRKNIFTLEDYRKQLKQIKKLGSLDSIIKMLPGFGKIKQMKNLKVDDKELIKQEAIINSMTRKERFKPEIINGSRRRRIAKGSGTSVQEVNKLLKNYQNMRDMLKKFNRKKFKGMPKDFSEMFKGMQM
jgi:signal recognition particle subunit SRP54